MYASLKSTTHYVINMPPKNCSNMAILIDEGRGLPTAFNPIYGSLRFHWQESLGQFLSNVGDVEEDADSATTVFVKCNRLLHSHSLSQKLDCYGFFPIMLLKKYINYGQNRMVPPLLKWFETLPLSCHSHRTGDWCCL